MKGLILIHNINELSKCMNPAIPQQIITCCCFFLAQCNMFLSEWFNESLYALQQNAKRNQEISGVLLAAFPKSEQLELIKVPL